MYRILGQLAMGSDGAQLVLPGGHRLTVLAVLLINANRRVSSTDLLRAAWGHTEVDGTQLHKCVSELRVLLGRVGRREDLVTHSRYGYELRVEEQDLDKLMFERLIREAELAGAQRRTEDEMEKLRSALRLWNGPHPLEGVPGDSFRREAAELEQRRKRAAVRLYVLELGAGRHDQIIGELSTIVSYHPTDRRLTELLMLALYHSGHATEALRAYEGHRAALAEEAGAEPESALRNLMYAIASADEQAIVRYESSMRQSDAAARSVTVPRQLPADPADFVGRDDPEAEAIWLLNREPGQTTPVVVITGPGGIGKTTLAVRVAHQVRTRYPDGQLHVELRGTTAEPLATEEALAQILRAFGARVPDAVAERATLYRTLVSDRRVLLLLDDARNEAQVRDLIPGNPACGVLITARQRLPAVDGAHHLPTLQPLDEVTATDLFQRVVRRSGVDSPPEPAATKQVVDLCAGLPLALWIAAALRARDPGRTTAELADRLAGQRLVGLVYSDRSVERSISVGFDRLDEDARTLFLALGLLEIPDFGLWTAAAVLHGQATRDPVEVLLRLAGGNLIQPTGPGMRYRFHDLTREYARRRAEREYPTAGARKVVLERVYGGLLTLVRRAHRSLYGGDFDVVHGNTADWAAPAGLLAELDDSPLDWYEMERSNIRAAIRHTADLGLAEQCWDLAVSTHEFYTVHNYLDDWHATHLIALDACRAAGNLRGEAALITTLGQPALASSGRAGLPTLDDLTRAAATFERLDDQHGQAIALRTLANALRRRGQYDRALDTFRQALALFEASNDLAGRWQALRYIGQTYLDLGRPYEALRELLAAQEATHAAGRPRPPGRETYWTRLLAQTTYWIGHTHLALGNLTQAREAFQYVYTAVGDTDDTSKAYAAHGIGEIARREGELGHAEEHLTAAATLSRQTDDTVLEGRAHLSLAHVHRRHDRAGEELAALELAVSCFTNGGATHLQADALTALGSAYARRDAVAPARAAWSAALALYTGMALTEQAEGVQRRLDSLPPVAT